MQRSEPRRFAKYDQSGAYHWQEMERNSPQYNPPLEARYKMVIKRLDVAGRVLDLGCGDGYVMNLARRNCRSVIGIDPEKTGVRLASSKLHGLPNCRVIQADGYLLPFAAESFDAVLMADVIEHLEAPDRCLAEVRRVLAPNGRLLVTTPKWRPNRNIDPHHVREYRPEDLERCLAAHFSKVSLTFFWPIRWWAAYRTRVGWHLIKTFARHLYNPFLAESTKPDEFGQILAVCER
jgi:SAM-dependent methyltransferase